jgi:prolyl oligopeptidase
MTDDSSPTGSEAEWGPDGQGFFYGRFPEPKSGQDLKGTNFDEKVYYHRLGTTQQADALVWEDPEHKDWRANATVTDDGSYLILTIEKGTDSKYRILYRPLEKPAQKPVHLVGEFEADYTFIDNEGPVFWFRTDKNAERGRVVAIDIRKPAPENWVDLIPEQAQTLQGVDVVAGHFLARYLKDAQTVVRVFDLSGKYLRDVDLPGIGTATGFEGKRNDKETFYAFTSFTAPDSIYRYDVAAGASTVWRQPKLTFNPQDYETTQVFYPSKDGTKIPMFLSHKKRLKRDGSAPALLYGYGGFNI